MKDPFLRGTFDRVRINVYLVLGRHDELFDLLEQLLAKPSQMTVRQLQTWSIYDPVRSLPRFQKLAGQQ